MPKTNNPKETVIRLHRFGFGMTQGFPTLVLIAEDGETLGAVMEMKDLARIKQGLQSFLESPAARARKPLGRSDLPTAPDVTAHVVARPATGELELQLDSPAPGEDRQRWKLSPAQARILAQDLTLAADTLDPPAS